MKAIKTIVLITGVLVAGIAFTSMAQVDEKVGKPTYAFHGDSHKHKNKKKHEVKAHKQHAHKLKSHTKHQEKHQTHVRASGRRKG
jgi:hypothetical protein